MMSMLDSIISIKYETYSNGNGVYFLLFGTGMRDGVPGGTDSLYNGEIPGGKDGPVTHRAPITPPPAGGGRRVYGGTMGDGRSFPPGIPPLYKESDPTGTLS